MTYIHFFNCALLTFGAPIVTYQASKLKDIGAALPCFYAGLFYVASQFAKLFLTATFVPSAEGSADNFEFTQEFMSGYINIIDTIFLYIIFNTRTIPFSGGITPRTKILSIALGWSIAESILTRLAPLWFGATEIEFKWDYLILAAEGSISIIYFISFATFAWLWTRNDLPSALLPVPIGFLISFCYVSNFYRYFQYVLNFDGAQLLAVKLVVSVCLFVLSQFFVNQYEGHKKKTK